MTENEKSTIRELSIELTVDITKVCDPIRGRSIFINQLLRSCSSIGANASEAKYAQSNADFVNKLEIALKECNETDYWLEILVRTNSIGQDDYTRLHNRCNHIKRKLISSITTVKSRMTCNDPHQYK